MPGPQLDAETIKGLHEWPTDPRREAGSAFRWRHNEAKLHERRSSATGEARVKGRLRRISGCPYLALAPGSVDASSIHWLAHQGGEDAPVKYAIAYNIGPRNWACIGTRKGGRRDHLVS